MVAVGDVREQQRARRAVAVAVVEQRHEGMRQHLVRAVADEDLLGIQPVHPGDALAQCGGAGVRVQAQPIGVAAQLGHQRIQHLRAGRVGVLVGVELDQVGQLGLLTRHVGGELVDEGAPEGTHEDGNWGRSGG